MKMILFIALLCPVFVEGAPQERLDPHGAKDLVLSKVKDLQGYSECTVCHTESKGKITLKPGAESSCFNCHNKAPHSGVADHLGKVFKGEKITCLSCHAPHRVQGKPWQGSSSFFPKVSEPTLSPKYHVSSKSNPMLRRTCTECHTW